MSEIVNQILSTTSKEEGITDDHLEAGLKVRRHYLSSQSTIPETSKIRYGRRHFIAQVYVELSSRGSDDRETSMNRALVYELPSLHYPL